jgi:hypothetical protein
MRFLLREKQLDLALVRPAQAVRRNLFDISFCGSYSVVPSLANTLDIPGVPPIARPPNHRITALNLFVHHFQALDSPALICLQL